MSGCFSPWPVGSCALWAECVYRHCGERGGGGCMGQGGKHMADWPSPRGVRTLAFDATHRVPHAGKPRRNTHTRPQGLKEVGACGRRGAKEGSSSSQTHKRREVSRGWQQEKRTHAPHGPPRTSCKAFVGCIGLQATKNHNTNKHNT